MRPTSDDPKHVDRLRDELYTSDEMIKEYEALQASPPEMDNQGNPCLLERTIIGLMFWSDATQLANFGHAKAWPLYMYLGNQSKAYRAKFTAGECHQVAYFPSVCSLILFTLLPWAKTQC